MFARCPKCNHAPLPAEQSLPAECPACGVILAKVGLAAPAIVRAAVDDAPPDRLRALLWHVPERVDASAFRARAALLAFFAVWGCACAGWTTATARSWARSSTRRC